MPPCPTHTDLVSPAGAALLPDACAVPADEFVGPGKEKYMPVRFTVWATWQDACAEAAAAPELDVLCLVAWCCCCC
eukprot:1145971-Pelagomonas_calceolata.AAC.7